MIAPTKENSFLFICDLDDSRWSSKKTNAMQLLREAREILAHEGEWQEMSGGHFDYSQDRLARDMFGWEIDLSYGKEGFSQVGKAGKLGPLEDRELSKLAWDLLCVIHSYDYYASGDTGEEQYKEDVQYFNII